MQFTYRDDSGRLMNRLYACIETALTKKHRWFIETGTEKQYKATVVAHAMATKQTWMYFCIPLPTEAYCKCSVVGTEISVEALLRWERQKILIFSGEAEKMDIQGWTSVCADTLNVRPFAELFSKT